MIGLGRCDGVDIASTTGLGLMTDRREMGAVGPVSMADVLLRRVEVARGRSGTVREGQDLCSLCKVGLSRATRIWMRWAGVGAVSSTTERGCK